MSIELGRRLIAAGAVHPSEIEAALYRHLVARVPFVRALLELGHLTEEALDEELARSNVPTLTDVIPLPALVDTLPQQMCRRLMAIPVRRDPRTGLIDVAAVDPFDVHLIHEFSYHLKGEVRLLRGTLLVIEHALARMDRGEFSNSVILRKSARPPGYAAPSVPPQPTLQSDRPIPLVKRTGRGKSIDVAPVRNVGPAHTWGSKVPPAPQMPNFGDGRPPQRERQQTSPGPPGVPSQSSAIAAPPVRLSGEPPAAVPTMPVRPAAPVNPSSVRRPAVHVDIPSAPRKRPEVPNSAPASSRRPEVPAAPTVGPPKRPEVPREIVAPAKPVVVAAPAPAAAPPPAPPAPAAPPQETSKTRARSDRAAAPAKAAPQSKVSSKPPAAAKAPSKAPPAAPTARPTGAAASPPAAPSSPRARSAAAASSGEPRGGARASSPPSTTRGPFSPKIPPKQFADISGVMKQMQSASSRDEIIDCLIVGMTTVARRVGVFAVKKNCYRGVDCNLELGDPDRFRNLEVSAESTTLLGIAATSDSYQGPFPVTPQHQDLLAFMKRASSEVVATLVRVAGRPAVILFADELADSTMAGKRGDELAEEASRAFSRILKEAKGGRK